MHTPNALSLGDLIEAAYDRASLVTSDRQIAGELAGRTVGRWLARAERLDLVRLLCSSHSGRAVRTTVKPTMEAQAA